MGVYLVALGLDLGSTTTKIAGLDAEGRLAWWIVEPTDPRMEEQADRMLLRARGAGAARGVPVVATGYGRNLVRAADKAVTEITCHARGAFRTLGHGGTLVDIGGQDSKVIVIDAAGRVVTFAMNDKCAAGTGRFIEVTAARLRMDLDRFSRAALAATEDAAISSTCTVFAESEIVGLIARGEPIDRIVRGLVRSLVRRVAALVRATGLSAPLMLSGGVARSDAVREFLGEELGERVLVPEHPQLVGAYGAALVAAGYR